MDKGLSAPSWAHAKVTSIVLAMLLAVTMMPAAGLQSQTAYADGIDEAAEIAADGFLYKVTDGKAVLVGFEEGAGLEGAVVVPETVSDGSATVAAVDLAEGQVAEGVTALSLPQTVESVETQGLATAFPNLASIEVAGSEGAYSSAAGMLFRQERGEASSDGSTTLLSNAELVWAPPAMVVARIPIECKAVAEGAFADAAALETVMAFGVMESIAEGAFAGDQVNRVTIVVPITNYASAAEGAERVSGSVQLSEGIPTSDKKRPWFDHGFDAEHIVSGAPFGEIDGVVAVSDDGVAEERSLVTPLENGRSHLDLTPEEAAEKAERRGVDPDHGLSFSYQASMDLSVRWSGDVTATPAHLEIPAYATIDGVKYQVTAIEPNGFAGAVFLESLVVPEGITAIGESAFENCSNLREVQLPSTLRTIDYAAFRGCSALESVDVPESVTWIGGEAFEDQTDVAITNARAPFGASESAALSELMGQEIANTTIDEVGTDGNIEEYATQYQFHLPTVGTLINFQLRYREVPNSASGWDLRYPGLTYDVTSACNLANPYLRADEAAVRFYCADNYLENGVRLVFVQFFDPAYAAHPWDCPTGNEYGFRPFDGEVGLNAPLRFYDASLHSQGGSLDTSGAGAASSGIYSIGGEIVVSFDLNGGNGDFARQTYVSGTSRNTYESLPTPTHADKVFVGWTLNGEPVDTSTQLPDPGVYTLVAQWDDINSTVSVEGLSDGKVTLQQGSFGGNATLSDDGKLVINPSGWSGEYSVYAKVENNGDLRIYSENSVSSANLGCTLKAPSSSDHHFTKWVIDGADVAPSSGLVEISNTKSHEFKIVFEPNTYRITYNVGTGGWVSDATNVDEYTFGTGCDLRDASRVKDAPGFWFAGWQLVAESGSSLGSSVPSGSATSTAVAPDAYGNIIAYAVWKPITYRINFVTAAAGYKQLPNTDDNLVIAKPNGGSQTFVHPVAYDKIAEITSSAGAPQFGGVDTTNHLDLTVSGIEAMCAEDGYRFAVPDDLLGYDWKGWTSTTDVALDQDATAYYVMREGDTGTRFRTFFGEAWSAPAREDVQSAYAYSLWHSVPLSTIRLGQGIRANVSGGSEVQDAYGSPAGGSYEPYRNNVGEAVDVSGVATGSPSLRWWPGRGLVGTDPAAAPEGTPSEAISTLTPSRLGTQDEDGTYHGMRLDAQMSLKAPVRYGFQFLGWGTDADDEGKLLIRYEENYAGGSGESKFSLTDEGAKLVRGWEDAWAAAGEDADARAAVNATASQQWVACWKIRTVDVALRIPLHAVSDADMTGASTGADATHGDVADFASGITKGQYADYQWREGTSSETEGGSTSGWYIANRTWNYGDLLEYPAFKTQQDRYTYDGWYHLRKPSLTDSTDKALEDLAGTGADLTKVATYQALEAPSSVYVTGGNGAGEAGGFKTDAGLDIGDAYFTVGDPSAKNAHEGGASVELWLWTSPVRINVASPMGVWLCTTNSYGQAVEPFVVGNDRRTQLEAQAEFQVSTSSHDLQLVDVTAEDIIAYDYNADKTVNAESVVSKANPTAPDEGICDKILNPKNEGNVNNLKYDQDGSRMFWVSPVPTATADQTGVVYKSEGLTAAEAASKVSETPKMASTESLLQPDVTSRRYFGFGTKDASGNADNRITDELASESGQESTYDLGAFILRKSYVGGVTDGLAQTSNEDGVTKYRFYYGLDMRRAEFDLAGLQDVIDNYGYGLEYNSAFDQPLLRVKFTFAAARNPGISYYSARLGEGADVEAYDASAEAAAASLDASVVVSAGAPTDL